MLGSVLSTKPLQGINKTAAQFFTESLSPKSGNPQPPIRAHLSHSQMPDQSQKGVGQQSQLPAGEGDEAESVGGEAGALVELELLQHVAAGADERGEVVVGDDHAAQVERLEALERRGELGDPGARIGAPVLRDEPVHGGARLPLDRERLQPREPREQVRGRRGVAEGHGDVLPRERVDAVPAAAHERHRLPVPRVVHVPQHQVQRLLRDAARAAEAHRAVQPPRLRCLPSHPSPLTPPPPTRRERGSSTPSSSSSSSRGMWPGVVRKHGDYWMEMVLSAGGGGGGGEEEERGENYWREKKSGEETGIGGGGGRLLLRDPARGCRATSARGQAAKLRGARRGWAALCPPPAKAFGGGRDGNRSCCCCAVYHVRR